MVNDHDLHHQLENEIDIPVDIAIVQKENHVKVTGKEGKEQENIGAQAVEIIEQVPVVKKGAKVKAAVKTVLIDDENTSIQM